MQGSGSGTVVEPLLALERADLSGVLEFRARGITTEVYVRDGEIVFATGGATGETLARMLVRKRRMSEEHAGALVRRMIEGVIAGERIRFGEAATEFGFLSQDELDLALLVQIREKLIGCLHRGQGQWRFNPKDKRVDQVRACVVSTRPMLVEACLALSDRRIREILANGEPRFPEIVAPENVLAEEFELTRAETTLVRELDGTLSLATFLQKPRGEAFAKVRVAPLVAALVLGRGVELRPSAATLRQPSDKRSIPPDFQTQRRSWQHESDTARMAKAPVPPPVPRPKGLSHSSPTLAVAAEQTQRRATREQLPPPEPDAKERAQVAVDKLKADLEVRRGARRRSEPDPKNETERKLSAESAFQQGRMFLRAAATERGMPGLHRAHELRPDEHEYELYVKWAQMLVNDTFKDNARRADIRALAITCVGEHRDCELALLILGYCAQREGAELAALRFFKRASDLDPKLADAARLAEGLEARRASLPDRALDGQLDDVLPAGTPVPPGLLAPKASPSVPSPTGPRPLPVIADAAEPPQSVTKMMVPPARSVPPAPMPEASVVVAEEVTAPHPPPVFTPTMPDVMPGMMIVSSEPPSGPRPFGVPLAFTPPPPAVATPFDDDETYAPYRKKRTGVWVAVWLAAIAVTATAAGWFVVARNGKESPVNVNVPVNEAKTGLATVGTPPTAVTAPTGERETTPPPTASAAPSAGPETTPPPVASAAADAPTTTTTTLHTPKAGTHRIFFDGRVIGEGGKDLTVPCGTHRVKIGSAGAERSLELPCGGSADL